MNQEENLKRAKEQLIKIYLNNNEVDASLINDKDKLLEHILFSTTIEEDFKKDIEDLSTNYRSSI